MEEEGEGIKRSQECVILVMVEMISAGGDDDYDDHDDDNDDHDDDHHDNYDDNNDHDDDNKLSTRTMIMIMRIMLMLMVSEVSFPGHRPTGWTDLFNDETKMKFMYESHHKVHRFEYVAKRYSYNDETEMKSKYESHYKVHCFEYIVQLVIIQ